MQAFFEAKAWEMQKRIAGFIARVAGTYKENK